MSRSIERYLIRIMINKHKRPLFVHKYTHVNITLLCDKVKTQYAKLP